METLKQWWDDFTDWANGIADTVDANKMLILLVLILLLGLSSGLAVLMDSPEHGGFESRQVADSVLLQWDAPEGGADLYEIQGRHFGGDWQTFTYTQANFLAIDILPGVVSFRVRPWTKTGPGPWSKSTEYFLFKTPVEIEDEAEVMPAVLRI